MALLVLPYLVLLQVEWGESDNDTVDLEPVAAVDESDNVSNSSGVDLHGV